MSKEEIKRQYANGIVNADEVIKSLVDKFKTDKTSVDIQQLQLIAEYLIYKVDKLQKENEDIKEKSKNILEQIEIIYQVHTKDCKLVLKDIRQWKKLLR